MSAYDHLTQFLDWGNASWRNGLGFVLVATQDATGAAGSQRVPPVAYTSGTLRMHHGDHMTGEADTFFSDRVAGSAPFDPARRDRLQMNLYADRHARTVRVELVFVTWGSGRVDLWNLRVSNRILVGDGPSIGNQTRDALYALTLAKVTL